MKNKDDVYDEQIELYTKAFNNYRGTAQATLQVHSDLQNLRFHQITQQIPIKANESLLDYGCGQGDLFKYLTSKNMPIKYIGKDINRSYLEYARNLYEKQGARFSLLTSTIPDLGQELYDHIVISGLLHFKGSCGHGDWEELIHKLLVTLFNNTRKTITFNCLTLPVDFEMPELFYWDPTDLIKFIRANFSRFFIINHSYPLFEWTCTVSQENFMHSCYRNSGIMSKFFQNK